ncbi:Pkinase-domain-containing protein, partial [Peniophora sp. CONT]
MVGKFIDNGALRLLDIIGCGGFGAVFRAFEPHAVKDFDNKLYAVKVVAKKREGSGRLTQLRELAFHMEVALHPHIVSFHRAFSDSEYRYIVLDNVPGGDLFSAITEKAIYLCEEELTKMVFLQLIDALAFCHAKGVYHRDVKPENVLVSADGRHWYLSDFGLATDSVRSASFKMGSKGYMSPEVVNAGKQYDFYYPRLNDIWALGAVFINVLASCGLWEEAVPTDYHYSFYLRNRDYIHYALPVTKSASHIIRRILEPIPEERISLAELRVAIAEVDRFYPSAAELRRAEP